MREGLTNPEVTQDQGDENEELPDWLKNLEQEVDPELEEFLKNPTTENDEDIDIEDLSRKAREQNNLMP